MSSATEIVHLEYDPYALPPPPSDEWTRFVCISDTHTRNFAVPPGDVLLHSGDLTGTGTLQGFQQTMDWLYDLPHKVKIIIAGNHDLPLHTGWYDENYTGWHSSKQALEPILELLRGPKAVAAGIVYLQDETYKFRTQEGRRTWSVFGSPWSPEFFNWAFGYERDNASALISKIPKTDILLTHGPPFKILDRTNLGDDVGCEALSARLPFLRPRLHLFGHIHEAHGAHIHTWDLNSDLPTANATYDPPTTSLDIVMDSNDESAGSNHIIGEAEAAFVESLERTVYVNAANWPSGRRAWRNGMKVPFGGLGFQPVIVDLKD